MNKELKEWLISISEAVVVAALVLVFIMPTIVRENSMESTLMPNDYLIVSRQEYKIFNKEIQRGDIIIFESNISYKGGNKLLVKRVIALGGDTIEIKNGNVYVNDELLQESYIKDGYTNGDVEKTKVPNGFLFCMGDNRLISLDSRSEQVGFVSENRVRGKAVFRLFPLSTFGKVE